MKEYLCPHCQEPGISFWRKMCLGPAVPAICKLCNNKVGVPYKSMIAVVPFLLSIFLCAFSKNVVIMGLTILIGFLVMSFIHMKLIPLEKR